MPTVQPGSMMDNLYISLPDTVDASTVEGIVDSVCAEEGLRATMKTTLKQYPGCIHWHFKQGKAVGVLEITWWSRQEAGEEPQLWLSVHGNRMSDWIAPVMLKLKSLIEAK